MEMNEYEEIIERNRGGRKQVKTGTTRRNARERNRVKHINDCFEILRQHIPNEKHNKKLSKVDTLKSAMIYIENLKLLLQQSSSYQQQQPNQLYPFDEQQAQHCFSNSNSNVTEHICE